MNEKKSFYLSEALEGWYFDVQDLNENWQYDDEMSDYYTVNEEEYDWMVNLIEAYRKIAELGYENELEYLNDYDDVIGFASNL